MSARRVLIVDDHPDTAESVARLLQRHGLETRTHTTGLGVLEAVAEFRPDVVLLDVDLPGWSGLAVARELAARPDRPRVFLCTGWDELHPAGEHLPPGTVDGSFPKSGDPSELVRLVLG